MLKLIPVYKIRVVYKSGYTHDFEATSFKIAFGTRVEWNAANADNAPIHIGFDDIAAVWQVGMRYKLGFKKKA